MGQAEAGHREPQDRNTQSLRSRSFTNLPGGKGAHQELGQDPRRGGDALRLPGSLIEELPQGRAHHTPWAELPIGQDRVPGGAPGAAREAQVPEPRAPGTQPKIQCSRQARDRRRLGGHRAARTLLPMGSPELCRSTPPASAVIRPLQTGRLP